MSEHITKLQNEVAALRTSFEQLARRFENAARELIGIGEPPAEGLLRDADLARDRFLDTTDAVMHLAAVAGAPPDTPPLTISALDALLTHLLGHLEAKLEQQRLQVRRDKAEGTLRTVLRLIHRDDGVFEPLNELHERAAQLLDTIGVETEPADPAVIEALAEGRHPFCDLLTLIMNRATDDADWDRANDSVTAAFGKPMSIAAVRGRLDISEPEPPAQDPIGDLPEEYPNDEIGTLEENRNGSTEPGADDEIVLGETAPPEVASFVMPEEKRAAYRRAMPDSLWLRSPLTAAQETLLLAPGNTVSVLFGSRLSGLDEVERFLGVASTNGRLITLDEVLDLESFRQQLSELFRDRPRGLIFVVVPEYGRWSADWIFSALEHVERQRAEKQTAKILFLADPSLLWNWLELYEGMEFPFKNRNVTEFALQPWARSMVRSWLRESELLGAAEIDAHEFEAVTGNWGPVVHQVAVRCQGSPKTCREHLKEFEREVMTWAGRQNLLGLIPEATPVLQAIANFDDVVEWSALTEVRDEDSPLLLGRVIRWAETLGYLRSLGRLRWSFNPLVRRLVLQTADA